MAVLSDVPGLQVQILVQGKALNEYRDRDAKTSGRTVERYVEAQSGMQFEIRYIFEESFPVDRPLSMIVTIDGKAVDEPLIRPHEILDPNGHISYGSILKSDSGCEVRKYQFLSIDIKQNGEETTPEELKAKLEPIGLITCDFYFLENLRSNRSLCGLREELETLSSVSEKDVKGDALTHQATLGDLEPTEEIEHFDADYADDGKPFATFHFYYRSLAALKDLHIIERTPDPLDLLDSDNTEIGQMNREQLEAIVRRFREQEETRRRVKRQRSSSETVVGDGDDVGERNQADNADFVELRSVDLRLKRRAMSVRQLPTSYTEVIVLDDD